jgi:hypothetical protein
MKLPGIIAIIVAAIFSWLIYGQKPLIEEVQLYKQEQAQVLNIRYGLLSLDEWKARSFTAISSRINGYELTGKDRRTLRPQISNLLNDLLSRAEAIANDKAASKGWIGDIVNFAVRTYVIDFSDIRAQIPDFTERVLDEIGNANNQRQVKKVLVQKLKEILDLNAPRADQAIRDYFFGKYNCTDYEECGAILQQKIDPIEESISAYRPFLMAALVLVFLPFLIGGKAIATKFNIVCLAVLAFVLLLGGIFYPMISVDARITDFSFSILGVSVEFGEQVLFYKSKSIIEIVQLLIEDGKLDTILVGILILLFSIIFPVVKIILSLVVSRGSKSRLVNFLTTKASKWSMADVFVVAIFMGFIGLQGLVGNQISQLESNNPFVDLVATDNTSLNIGFTLFTLFCLSSLLLGSVTKNYLQNATEDL